MSDPKPDRILAEESDNPWVKLILWSNEHPLRPADRWNGFMKYLVEERRARLVSLKVTDARRLGFMKDWGVDREQFERASPLSGDELEHAKNLFPFGTDFSQPLRNIMIDNLIFRKGLSFAGAIFAGSISFENCCFERSVDFYGANFEREAVFSGSEFLETVNFGDAQFRVGALFNRVTFCGRIDLYCYENESNLLANFTSVIFEKKTPRFHGRNFHPGSDFHGVTWPDIPKRNGHKKTQDTIEDALLEQITSYEYIRTQAEHIGQLELRKEMIRRELACRAELAEPSFERYLRKAYGWICDHGTSIGRPALALLCIWGFTFAAWRGWAAQEAAVTTWDVLYHTGGRMLPFVGGHAYVEEHTLKALRAAPHVLHFLSAMAAILSPFLLFLMALALRLKFRMSV
jgi:uncharacterized protein YjbI with pentapeptide repeats